MLINIGNALNINWNIDYGELASDIAFVTNFEGLKTSLMELQQLLENILPLRAKYDTMPLPSQIDIDLIVTITLNTLFWIQLKLNGMDTSQHPIKYELVRIKMVMEEWQAVKDRDKRPTVDIAAAKRFIKSGLYDRYQGAARPDPSGEPVTKKNKLNEN
ncbi:unnamed protein product [Pieris macdunnoughi]|uniref:Nuclear nucleic acid-binding protein C1D n=1 Tax=Pieris macdunnoughi TaxID=345717 RepID=A0A821SMP1_9NEOP|nr:unnamed protein product [Pieris macdunnoughi]